MTTATAHTSASARDILNAQSTKHREYHPTHCHPPREGARFVVHGSHVRREVSAQCEPAGAHHAVGAHVQGCVGGVGRRGGGGVTVVSGKGREGK